MHQSHRFVGYRAVGNNFLAISFLNNLCCLYLLGQAKSLTWIIMSGSASSKAT